MCDSAVSTGSTLAADDSQIAVPKARRSDTFSDMCLTYFSGGPMVTGTEEPVSVYL